MKNLKKALKLIFLVLLIVLASLGIGLTGVAPPLLNNHKRNSREKTKTEQIEPKKKKSKFLRFGG
jgi:hypothetical protein